MITRSVLSSPLLALLLPVSFAGAVHAASVTYDADTATTGAQDGSGAGWNTTGGNTGFWNGTANVAWPNTTADELIFGAGSGAAGPVTVGTVTANKITFGTPGSGNYSLTGGTITLGGTTPTIAVNNDASIGSAIAGTVGFTKSGTGVLTLTAANAYTGATSITGGSVTFNTGGSTGGGTLALGTASGSRAVFNMNSTGTLTHNTTINIGGAAASANGAGAINQSAGTVNAMNSAGYLQLGNGGYGSYNMSGGILNLTNASGFRIGDNTGGLASFVQSGGTINMTRYFVVGGPTGTAPNAVATFTGGTMNGPTGFYIIAGNAGTASGTVNVGTQAGGNGNLVSRNANGISLGDQGTATGILNLNSGTVQFNAGTIRKGIAAGTGIANFNGGKLQATATGLTLVNNTLNSANVYNGGLTVDTQAFPTTISANLLTTTGNGIYPASGVINQPAPTGSGYIGAPLVSVTTSGTGTAASAVANVTNGQVTGVSLTCPGQGYTAGDTVTFTFAGGGSTAAAAPFVYTLTAGDLAANGTGGLTKLGTGTLTLSGANTFTGPVDVTGGLTATNLSLNNTTLTVHGFSPGSGIVPIQATTGFSTGGTVLVDVDSPSYPVGSWPVIYYPVGGSIGGSGISALQVKTGSLPRGVVATLLDNTANGSVDLNVTASNPLTWKGNLSQVWDINTTSNWVIGAAAQKYLDDDVVVFNDSATGSNTNVVLNTTVLPQNVTFDNFAKNYSLSGTGSIGGTTPILKSNIGTVTILNANTTTGITTVSGGTLQFGDGATNGSVAGPLVNNGTVVFNPAGTSTALPGSISGDGTGFFIKSGSGTQVLTNAANTYSGTFQVNGGTLQFGNGTTNGTPGSATYELAAGTTMHLNSATAVQATSGGWASKVTGPGTLEMSTAQPVNGTAIWGPNSTAGIPLSPSFTGTVKVNEGRFDSSPTGLGGTSKIVVGAGAQFMAWAGTYSVPIEIAGTGWGETGYPGGLRLAGSTTSAAWNGSVTLTADSGIMCQRATNFIIGGAITGAYVCEFYAGDPSGENGVITVNPTVPGQNTYAATKINGRVNGSVVAGSDQAFSTGPLEVASAILKLNGHSHSFASLSGAGGAIGNYAATPATLTVGDSNSTAYAGVLRDGAAAPLALTKTGSGTLTLSTATTYTGNTTVSQGKLVLSGATLGDASTVSIATGAVLELNTGSTDTVGSVIVGSTTLTPGTYSASHPVYGAYFAGSGSLVIAGGGYDSWAASKGLDGTPGKENGVNDDPDKDGIKNLAEFYLDGNPLGNDQGILPVATMNATYLTLTFKRRDDAELDVTTQAVRYGSNLTGWTDVSIGATSATSGAGVIVTVTENASAADDITVQIPRTLAADGRLFARLNVVK